MWFRLLFLVLSLNTLPLKLNANIKEVWDLKSIWEKTDDLNQDDLILFDVSHTLILEKDMILRPCRRRCLNHLLELKGVCDPKKREELISQVLLQREITLVDPNTLKLVKELQKKGVKVIALTSMKSGSFGHIDHTEQWRAKELQKMGLDFRNAFPQIKTLVLHEFPHPTSPPTFEQGVLCSSYHSKGEVLGAFLNKINFFPRQVIFVDNRYHFLESVETKLQQMGIPFTGLHYRAWVNLPGESNESVEDFQIRYLISHKKWLSDQEAKEAISNP